MKNEHVVFIGLWQERFNCLIRAAAPSGRHVERVMKADKNRKREGEKRQLTCREIMWLVRMQQIVGNPSHMYWETKRGIKDRRRERRRSRDTMETRVCKTSQARGEM